MKRFLLAALVAATAAVVIAATPAWAALSPPPAFSETVDVNVVFVGMAPTSLAGLPASSSPRSATSSSRAHQRGAAGNHLQLPYTGHDTSAAWEDQFFAYLTSIAMAKPRTLFQDQYNAQAGARDVGQNHWIDAPSVEKWLIAHPPAGVDTTKPTMFFVNWWVVPRPALHRPRLHEARGARSRHRERLRARPRVAQDRRVGGTAPDDEETGYGGSTAHRVWFYDLSAGPETWAGSFEVTNQDIDGDGVKDYRIPNIWEYSGAPLAYNHPGYGPATLSDDLKKVVRVVGLDLLFTTSPLYPPYFKAEQAAGLRAARREYRRRLESGRRVGRVHRPRALPRRRRRSCRRASTRASRRSTRTSSSTATGTVATSSSSPTRSATTTSIPSTSCSAGS